MQDTFRPLVEFVPGSPWFISSAALGNSQVACLMFCSVMIVSLALKSPYGVGQLSMYCIVESL